MGKRAVCGRIYQYLRTLSFEEGCMSVIPTLFPTFFLVVAPKSFVPRDSGIEEAQWVLRDVLVGKNLVVADDFCQRE